MAGWAVLGWAGLAGWLASWLASWLAGWLAGKSMSPKIVHVCKYGNLFILLPPRTPYFNVGHGAELLTSDPPVCHTACQ